MVQEVQTGVGITNETTLETIEAIGTSSFKIVEGRQTKGGHYVSSCAVTYHVAWQYYSPASTTSPYVKAESATITNSSGKYEYIVRDNGLRVPVAGTYGITLHWGTAGTSHATLKLIAGGKEIYSKYLSRSNAETVTFQYDLGKFDIIEVWCQFEYVGGQSSANVVISTGPDLTIQQL